MRELRWALQPRRRGIGLEPNEILRMDRDAAVSPQDRVWLVAEGYAKRFKENWEPLPPLLPFLLPNRLCLVVRGCP